MLFRSLSEFVSLKRVYGPQSVTRFNLFNSATINGAPAPGYSSGDAIAAVQEVSAESLPSNFSVDYSGLTREEVSAGSQTTFILILSILFVYFIIFFISLGKPDVRISVCIFKYFVDIIINI